MNQKTCTVPDSVTSIGYAAFSGCSSLTSIAIPYSVTTIENNAFERCSSLTSITIPDSVTIIEWEAFDGCSSLISIINLNPSPQTVDEKFFIGNDSNLENITLYVPAESVELYKTAEGWKDFGTVTAYVPKDETEGVR